MVLKPANKIRFSVKSECQTCSITLSLFYAWPQLWHHLCCTNRQALICFEIGWLNMWEMKMQVKTT